MMNETQMTQCDNSCSLRFQSFALTRNNSVQARTNTNGKSPSGIQHPVSRIQNLAFLYRHHASRITLHVSIQHPRMHIRSMHRRMAPSAPARSLSHVLCVGSLPNVNLATRTVLDLRVTSQTEVRVALYEKLSVY